LLLETPFLVELLLNLHGPLQENLDYTNLLVTGNVYAWAEKAQCLGYYFDSIKTRLDYQDSLLQDPLMRIDLQTKVKRHRLFFHLFGMPGDMIFSAKSVPYLAEDQILSLFFTGISDHNQSSRYFLTTALTKLEATLQNKAYAKSAQFLKKVTTPLQGIKVAPCLPDFTKNASPAASLFIDMGDNLSASIVKDLSDKDDLRLNLEYLLSENLVFKLDRNLDGLLQGLVEMRFRF